MIIKVFGFNSEFEIPNVVCEEDHWEENSGQVWNFWLRFVGGVACWISISTGTHFNENGEKRKKIGKCIIVKLLKFQFLKFPKS